MLFFTVHLALLNFSRGVEARHLPPGKLAAGPCGVPAREQAWGGGGMRARRGRCDLAIYLTAHPGGVCIFQKISGFQKIFPFFFFFPGSRDPSINSWNTNKITKIYTFSPSCGSGIGKRSLRYCICKHDVQVQTTQLDLQLYVHCWHSKDANLQVVYKKDCPGHLCISRSADACNYTHIKGICIFLAHPSSENKRNFRK